MLVEFQEHHRTLQPDDAQSVRQRRYHEKSDRLGAGIAGRYNYAVRKDDARVELNISRNGDYAQSKAAFDALVADRESIDRAFGGDRELKWERMDNAITSKIVKHFDVGGYADESR